MNILVLGGKTKFGAHLTSSWSKDGHEVLAVGRQDLDFASGWVTPLKELITKKFKTPSAIQVIVVNVYDSRRDCSHVQSHVLNTIWELFRKQRVLVIVMGSLSYRYSKSEFSLAKKHLAEQCLRYSDPFEVAKLLLVEPGVLENNRERYPSSMWTKFDSVVKLINSVADSDFRFLQLVLKGTESPTPIQTKAIQDDNARTSH